jgi:hypothetical protein
MEVFTARRGRQLEDKDELSIYVRLRMTQI